MSRSRWHAYDLGLRAGGLFDFTLGTHPTCDLHDEQLKDDKFRERYIFVLRGFKFTYARDDYAIKKIRITEGGGVISVDLHDRGGKNQFAVIVDYALVPRALIASSATIEGESRGANTATHSCRNGNTFGFFLGVP